MPLYEYQCQTCGRRLEVLQRHGDPQLETCPECGGALRKLLSAPSFQFKGSGWYVTDYARSGGTGAKASGPDGGDSAKSEPSAPAESKEKKGDAAATSSPAAATAPASTPTKE